MKLIRVTKKQDSVWPSLDKEVAATFQMKVIKAEKNFGKDGIWHVYFEIRWGDGAVFANVGGPWGLHTGINLNIGSGHSGDYGKAMQYKKEIEEAYKQYDKALEYAESKCKELEKELADLIKQSEKQK